MSYFFSECPPPRLRNLSSDLSYYYTYVHIMGLDRQCSHHHDNEILESTVFSYGVVIKFNICRGPSDKVPSSPTPATPPQSSVRASHPPWPSAGSPTHTSCSTPSPTGTPIRPSLLRFHSPRRGTSESTVHTRPRATPVDRVHRGTTPLRARCRRCNSGVVRRRTRLP